METILITGGAGFIGGYIAEKLHDKGYKIIVYDNLSPQVHGNNADLPDYLKEKVEFIKADVRDIEQFKNAIQKSDKIIHLAAETGVGQSMYEIDRYVDVNVRGTSILWDILANEKHNIKKVVLSSSRAVYGEGKYKCKNCGIIYPRGRSKHDLEKGRWDVYCPNCNKKLEVMPTAEDSILTPASIYAVTKKTQEEICMIMGKSLGIPVSILRYQNVYGPRQSLNNPYTGIITIFTNRLKENKPINIYEDGYESRDFVYVEDVADGTILALEKVEANYEIFNIGYGKLTTIRQVAEIITNYINRELRPVISGNFRLGDIRNNYADISKANKLLGYHPKYSIEEGIKSFIEWAIKQESKDDSLKAEEELKRRGLFGEA
ncbi:SDR family NAD(P)-dependent oxidoreductase [Thermoanaerobacterium thermosaccharolyticum]|uniref:SDR family NAD(P)-dependent oxidoreductase n=1 Tax=Thermoanaerobacterium thermosaccharolyticum TaxID=1517 RepID=UPI001776CB36|nr:SDR family NAD(P)-dependent oxidoreductase [Thermoanaerobacterium sp.]